MTDAEIIALVVKTREAQRKYFNDRKPSQLNEARDWERRLDAALKARGKGPGLFEQPIS